MVMEERHVKKSIYKIELYLLKVIPVIIAGIYLLNSILSYFDIDIIICSIIGGMSILPLLFLYISSYVFRFCIYHRLPLYYILIIDIINYYDLYIGIPISNIVKYCIIWNNDIIDVIFKVQSMQKVITKLLTKLMREVADKIDAGTCELSEEESINLMSILSHTSLSKEQACNYLNLSRSRFDDLVIDGIVPRGKKRRGFKELVWYADELDKVKYNR